MISILEMLSLRNLEKTSSNSCSTVCGTIIPKLGEEVGIGSHEYAGDS